VHTILNPIEMLCFKIENSVGKFGIKNIKILNQTMFYFVCCGFTQSLFPIIME
jgi:hypothetical protein